VEIVSRIVDDLKDENEQYRKMVMETTENIIALLGANEIDSRLEEQLIDGILYAFQDTGGFLLFIFFCKKNIFVHNIFEY
jgi:splicing factor 3B subunit 1